MKGKIMKKNHHYLYVLLLMFNIFNNIAAADIFFPGGNTPHRPLINEDGVPQQAAVIVKNPLFISYPDENKGENLDNSLKFLDLVTVYNNTYNKKFCLVKIEPDSWGWMKENEILTKIYCMRTPNPNNPAYYKVIVKNNWRLNKGNVEEIPFYKGPGESYDIAGYVNVFRVRFAYKLNKNPNFIFIGDEYKWNYDFPSSCLKGWIKRDYCIPWASHVGVFYNKENLSDRYPVLMFEDLKELEYYLEVGDSSKAIAREERTSIELKPDTTRFPIMDHVEDSIQVTFVGDAIDSKTKKIKSRQQIDNMRGQINRLIYNTKKIDLLFLIDATKSMGPYFKPVADGINSFINSLSPTSSSRFKFGFAVYRDHADGNDSFQMLCQIGQLDNNELQKKIKEASFDTRSKDSDYPEAVYEGIYNAVNVSHWRENSTRAIVIIGDHGNHIPLKTEIGLKDVKRVLEKQRVVVYALNVRLRSETKSFCIQFQNQMSEIIDNNKQYGKIKIISSKSGDELKETKNEIEVFLSESFDFSTNVSTGFQEMAEDGSSIETIKRKYGTNVTNYMLDILKLNNWTEEDIKISKFNQFCSEGWVSKKSKNGLDNFKTYFLITRQKLDMLVGLLARISIVANASSKDINDMVRSECEVATGDPMKKDETIAKYIQRIFFIPYNELSNTLNLTPEELQDKMDNNTFKNKFIKLLSEKYERLHFIQEGKTGDLKWNPSRRKHSSENTKSKEWWFVSASGVKWCWIPFEYLP